MKTIRHLVTFAMIAFSSHAAADGFVCSNDDIGLNVKVFNHTQPEVGTRTGAVMIISDQNVDHGRKVIARFFAEETLTNETHNFAYYTAIVDHRYNDSGRKGELIAGTKIGNLKKIGLSIPFTYAEPVEAGVELESTLSLRKRDGSYSRVDMICTRYLKN